MMVFLNYLILFLVDPGTKAVVWDRYKGVLPKAVGEGTHFRIPLMQVLSNIKNKFIQSNLIVSNHNGC